MKKIYTLFFALTISCFIHAQIITTVAGNGIAGFSGDGGQATAAKLNGPGGLIVDPNGVIYIADASNNRIRKVNTNGVISTFAGNGTAGFSGDNGNATTAALDRPIGLALDSRGDLYIADYNNHRIRKVTMSTGIITTVAGNGQIGFSGDGAAATVAGLSYPTGVCFDAADNMYIADQGNYRARRVDKITGIISTVAGNGLPNCNGDGGPATAAAAGNVYDVKCDSSGNVIFSVVLSHCIRKVDMTTGTISTICGVGSEGFSGDGGPAALAELAWPEGIAIDGGGNIFVAELYNARVRRIDAITGIITTAAGNGLAYSGDGGPPTSAGVNADAAATSGTNLYIADLSQRIRKVTDVAVPHKVVIVPEQENPFSLFPNPSYESFSVGGIAPNTLIQIFDAGGNLVFSETRNENEPINISRFAQAVYVVRVEDKKIKLIKM